ncbi:MAG: formylglycine-generating enzyme family protein [Acidobacteriota bacterium]|nr:formylglycine-generating enzyme family protein [Blastocatellia bacterium]MDW8413197.1 formylglycine-generating enzyme family protein [Acidobacteriota bacterium]
MALKYVLLAILTFYVLGYGQTTGRTYDTSPKAGKKSPKGGRTPSQQPVVQQQGTRTDGTKVAEQPTPRPPIVPVMVRIPAGSFDMGYEGGFRYASPVHTVEMHAFEIGAYEVTNEEFEAFVDDTGYKTEPELRNAPVTWRSYFTEGREKYPVVLVSWHDANNFCKWLSSKTGSKFRLPTEAEWEYAARGGLEGMLYPWGDDISPEQANYDETGTRKMVIGLGLDYIRQVGSYKPNGYGLYDVAGNVWEWCSDWFDDYYYRISPEASPTGPEAGIFKVMRGGGWMDPATACSVAYRGYNSVNYSAAFVGFRVVREAK